MPNKYREILQRAAEKLPELKKEKYQNMLIDALEKREITDREYPDNPIEKIKGEYKYDFDIDADVLEKVSNIQNRIVQTLLSIPEYQNSIILMKPTERLKVFFYSSAGDNFYSVKLSRIIKEIRDRYPDVAKKLQKLMTLYPSKKKSEYIRIRISTDPVDILMKSSGRSWAHESCERLGGPHEQGPFSDIANHNGIAYFYYDDNTEPSSRVMLRWCKAYKYNEETDEPEYKGLDIGVEPIMYPRGLSWSMWAYDILTDILRRNGYGDYDYCVTPYIYEGYSDQMGKGNTQIKYLTPGSDNLMLYASDPEISRNVALALLNAKPAVRRALAENASICGFPDVVDKMLNNETDAHTIENLLANCNVEFTCKNLMRVIDNLEDDVGVTEIFRDKYIPKECFVDFIKKTYEKNYAASQITDKTLYQIEEALSVIKVLIQKYRKLGYLDRETANSIADITTEYWNRIKEEYSEKDYYFVLRDIIPIYSVLYGVDDEKHREIINSIIETVTMDMQMDKEQGRENLYTHKAYSLLQGIRELIPYIPKNDEKKYADLIVDLINNSGYSISIPYKLAEKASTTFLNRIYKRLDEELKGVYSYKNIYPVHELETNPIFQTVINSLHIPEKVDAQTTCEIYNDVIEFLENATKYDEDKKTAIYKTMNIHDKLPCARDILTRIAEINPDAFSQLYIPEKYSDIFDVFLDSVSRRTPVDQRWTIYYFLVNNARDYSSQTRCEIGKKLTKHALDLREKYGETFVGSKGILSDAFGIALYGNDCACEIYKELDRDMKSIAGEAILSNPPKACACNIINHLKEEAERRDDFSLTRKIIRSPALKECDGCRIIEELFEKFVKTKPPKTDEDFEKIRKTNSSSFVRFIDNLASNSNVPNECADYWRRVIIKGLENNILKSSTVNAVLMKYPKPESAEAKCEFYKKVLDIARKKGLYISLEKHVTELEIPQACKTEIIAEMVDSPVVTVETKTYLLNRDDISDKEKCEIIRKLRDEISGFNTRELVVNLIVKKNNIKVPDECACEVYEYVRHTDALELRIKYPKFREC